ncbi:signal transduction histidine kinase [Cystobacter fuscus DSM 2262]|uniref:histidine kinase n=1 Tax=Cystobacter fuscus (strain ATCC 25194 / DSM 2262 / NBRC 100088 / M29) TaxID=1242864 RepID=S9P9B5_CYSF2|nr:ATP-binding protein [Cystobacter fuscus]EPX61005.1 signal transduction histidine kinase [Cystobacter fuscus DSM 2262]
MGPDLSDTKAMREVQRKSYFNGAACLVGALLVHCAVTWSLSPALVGSLLFFILVYVGLGLALERGWFEPEQLGVPSGLVGLLCATTLVHFSGGPLSPYFHVFGALPFMLALFTPGSQLPTLVSGGAALLAVLLVGVLAQVPPSTLVLQAFSSLALLWLALFGTRVYRRMIAAQQESHQSRLQVLEQLAESERLRGRAERERAEVERLVLMGQLAAGVAHEVNNPLAFVKANLSFLRGEANHGGIPRMEPWELCELLEETLQGVVRIQQIVTDLRGFSRSGQLGEAEEGVLEEALHEARRLASVRLGREGEVALEIEPELSAVRLSQRHMVQVMVNLLLNAADAVEAAHPPRHAHITVSARREGQAVCLRVEDNGPGIPPEVLPHIFDAFFTTKPPGRGTGLGLALCSEYVSRAGGTLHAENRPEGGARFVMRLPLVAQPPPGPS